MLQSFLEFRGGGFDRSGFHQSLFSVFGPPGSLVTIYIAIFRGFSEFSRGSKIPTRGVPAYPLRALKKRASLYGYIIEPYVTLAGDLLPRPLIPPMR
jgi:hypothetical protein